MQGLRPNCYPCVPDYILTKPRQLYLQQRQSVGRLSRWQRKYDDQEPAVSHTAQACCPTFLKSIPPNEKIFYKYIFLNKGMNFLEVEKIPC